MTHPRIESITVEGHTSMLSARVDLRDLNVLVGANGSGKSNFVRALEMLGRIAEKDLEYYVNSRGRASTLLRQDGSRKGIRLVIEAPPNRYEALLTPTVDDRLIFGGEWMEYLGPGHDKPWRQSLGRGHRETQLHNEVSEHPDRKVAIYVISMLSGCRVYHFHDTSDQAAVKQTSPTADNLALRSDAGNLAAVLLRLRQHDAAAYARIVGAVHQVAPFLRDFVLEPEATDTIRLRWRQVDSETVFSAHQMSDGTLRFVCLATLLLPPPSALPRLMVLDEPELGLHPYAIVQLAEMLRAASVSSQVVIATQSVTLMDQFSLEDLIVVEREHGASTFSRPEPERLREWLDEYSLGELWQKNLIGGRPQRETA